MCFRSIGSVFVAALFLVAGAGCRKSEPVPSAPPSSPPPVETVARVHWLGKKQLAAETNAASFMDIWKLSESVRLERQTLDKLSLAPWRLLQGDAATNGAPAALLRPLLDDAVQEESYLEIRGATNQPGELAFAIRLGPERGGLWETNLAAVLESLTGIQPMAATGDRRGWSLKKHDAPNLVELTRVGDWTVIGLAQEQNALLSEMLARIKRDQTPFAARATNFWLEADLDLRRVCRALSLGWNLPEGLPKFFATVIGGGDRVLTRGRLDFASPQSFQLEAWNIPTNLVHSPLIGFTAIRGLKPWLASQKTWSDLQLGAPPNQVCLWTVDGMPAQHYFAAPLPDASNRVQTVGERLMQKGNPWLAAKAVGEFKRSPDLNGVVWTGPPFVSPFLRSTAANGDPFVFGGLFPNPPTNPPLPNELLQALSGRADLIGYDWELTGPRIDAWIYTGQLMRFLFQKAQLPPASASMAWFKVLIPRLGNCTSALSQTGPQQLSFVRQSGAGFTAAELHWLADWLESPEFPRGTHTALATPLPAGALPE